MSKLTPTIRAFLAILALVTIVISASWLSRISVVGSYGLDFSEHNVHTLTDGTHKILSELDPSTPVTVRFYATRESPLLSREQKLFIGKIDSLLKKYDALANGAIKLEFLDPQPDTDEEDSAKLDGIAGNRVRLGRGNQEENIYLGISVSCLDQKTKIDSLSPSGETMLEYELSRAVAEVSRFDKPVMGIITSLPLEGRKRRLGQQQGVAPWVIYRQLLQTYDVKNLGSNPKEIDPDLTSLLVFHPQKISEETEYAIDQYLLGGGTVIACLDPMCLVAKTSMGPSVSDLPKLMKAWGVDYSPEKALFDIKYRTQLPSGVSAPVILSLTKESIASEDEVTTQGLNDLIFPVTAAFEVKNKGLDAVTLIKSSERSGIMPAIEATDLDGTSSLLLSEPVDPNEYPLALRLTGDFKTAFPDGKPKPKKIKDEKNKKPATPEKEIPQKKSSEGKGTVVLISDVDFASNPFAFDLENYSGRQVLVPKNGNASLLLNIVDQAMGSKHLIGARGRASTRRPFTVIDELEAEYEKTAGQKELEIEQKASSTKKRLEKLVAEYVETGSFEAEGKYLKEKEELQAEEVKYAKELREMQKGLQTQKDELAGNMIKLTMLPVIGLVIITGFFVGIQRKRKSGAKG